MAALKCPERPPAAAVPHVATPRDGSTPVHTLQTSRPKGIELSETGSFLVPWSTAVQTHEQSNLDSAHEDRFRVVDPTGMACQKLHHTAYSET